MQPSAEKAVAPLRQSHKTLLIWLILIVVFVSIYSMFADSSTKAKEIDVKEFKAALASKETAAAIEKVKIEPGGRDDARYVVTYRDRAVKGVVYGPYPEKVTEMMDAAGVEYSVKVKDDSSIWPQILLS